MDAPDAARDDQRQSQQRRVMQSLRQRIVIDRNKTGRDSGGNEESSAEEKDALNALRGCAETGIEIEDGIAGRGRGRGHARTFILMRAVETSVCYFPFRLCALH